jgi:hypothetical protein
VVRGGGVHSRTAAAAAAAMRLNTPAAALLLADFAGGGVATGAIGVGMAGGLPYEPGVLPLSSASASSLWGVEGVWRGGWCW